MKSNLSATLIALFIISSSACADEAMEFWHIKDYVREFLAVDPVEISASGVKDIGQKDPSAQPFLTSHIYHEPDRRITTPKHAALYIADRFGEGHGLVLPKAKTGDEGALRFLGGVLRDLFREENNHLLPIKIGKFLTLIQENANAGVLELQEGQPGHRVNSRLEFVRQGENIVFTEFEQELVKFNRNAQLSYELSLRQSLRKPEPRMLFSIGEACMGSRESFSALIKSGFRPFVEQPGRISRIVVAIFRKII